MLNSLNNGEDFGHGKKYSEITCENHLTESNSEYKCCHFKTKIFLLTTQHQSDMPSFAGKRSRAKGEMEGQAGQYKH